MANTTKEIAEQKKMVARLVDIVDMLNEQIRECRDAGVSLSLSNHYNYEDFCNSLDDDTYLDVNSAKTDFYLYEAE